MRSSEIASRIDESAADFALFELMERVNSLGRASWLDIHKDSGVYVVYINNSKEPEFNHHGGISSCNPTKRERLSEKWNGLNAKERMDIIYIGRGNVRSRVRALVRFGLGKTRKHGGGEWLWQIDNLQDLRILISPCPLGLECNYEKYLLDSFKNQHGDWPLANRQGGTGIGIWKPY